MPICGLVDVKEKHKDEILPVMLSGAVFISITLIGFENILYVLPTTAKVSVSSLYILMLDNPVSVVFFPSLVPSS